MANEEDCVDKAIGTDDNSQRMDYGARLGIERERAGKKE